MINEKPHIHLFKTPGRYYIFDVNTNRMIDINQKVYQYLQKGTQSKDMDDEIAESIDHLVSKGFLLKNPVKEISHPLDEHLEYFYENKMEMLTLQVTQQCNFRCEYCTYSGSYVNRGHENKKMNFDTAKAAMDFFISRSKDSKRITLAFYGGEPLLEFNLIKQCIEYMEINVEGKELVFSMTTNGTLLDKEIIDFLSKRSLHLLISLDGPKEVHDKNRKYAKSECSTFDTIMNKMEMIRTEFPEFYEKILFSVVLDTESNFNCIQQFFASCDTVKNSQKIVNAVSNVYTDKEVMYNETHILERKYEEFKLLLSKLNRLDYQHVSPLVVSYFNHLTRYMFDSRTATQSLPEKAHHSGPCVPGAHRLFVDVNGNFLPCEKVSESSETMKIGNLDSGFDIKKCRDLLNVGKVTEKQCKNCWAINYCTLCAVYADNLHSLDAGIKLRGCKNMLRDVEGLFKDFCTLKEFGYQFDKNLWA
ncbi:MAG: Cys-rich peptide radical SAM maturase CcpM [Clostridia bacterium]|nr:Cys-rich peptide radical SAM maturase CcpM [Clostridia bacterium]